MSRGTPVNPWIWQDQFGFSQAIDVREPHGVLYCSGQTSVDADGNPLHKGDMAAQIDQAIDNLERVLSHAGLTLADVVRLNYYTTDMDAFFGAAERFGPRLHAAGCKPSSTLVKVVGLFHPDVMVELEATAVR